MGLGERALQGGIQGVDVGPEVTSTARLHDLLNTWRWNSRTANVAHLRATDSLTFRNLALGGTAAVLGALVGLGVFATLQSSHVVLGVRIAAGAAAFAAAASAALWKYLNYGPRIEHHRKASRAYGNMVRELDEVLKSDRPVTKAVVTPIRKQLDKIDNAAPNVSGMIWVWAVAAVAKQKLHPSTIDASTVDRGALSRVKRLLRWLFV
jgi:hypothetical protein